VCRRKLVRDLLGPLLEAEGARVLEAGPGEAEDLLLEKILEEAGELAESRDPVEAADLLEALLAWARLRGLTLEDILAIAEEKRRERGGFTRLLVAEHCPEGGGVQALTGPGERAPAGQEGEGHRLGQRG